MPHPVRVVLGVSGGIAAYKAAALLRLFTEAGYHVDVVPTPAALRFVGAPTWEALSGNRVSTDVFTDVPGVRHVALGQRAGLIVVAPATADLIARLAAGMADDLLTSSLLVARCPVLLAPAMHTEMWQHPATVANVATLRERGVVVLEPAHGRLTGADTGPGRLPEPEVVYAAAVGLLATGADLAGRTVVVSAGGTREPLDPVRYLGNRSSGKQGYAIAAAARERGATVILIGANTSVRRGGSLTDPTGVQVVDVETAAELQQVVTAAAQTADVIVMAAAVADFRPAQVSGHKIKKSDDGDDAPVITLTRNPDILADLCANRRRAGQLIVGFAAETGDSNGSVLDHGRAKLARKGCDLLVVNEVGPGKAFGTDDNTVSILGSDGSCTEAGPAGKGEISHAILDVVARHL
jgi:phosphopantothenoylcysteine decarboxylase/phosphopantothenate--cysteine ligase